MSDTPPIDRTSEVEDAASQLLAELADDFAGRCRRGERPSVQDYARKHPALAGEIRELFPAMLVMEKSGIDPTIQSTPVTERIGSMVGPYKLLEQIGGGGMGVVYMAEQLHPVRRKVALKIIKPGMDSGQVIARFEAERQALTMMDHPNIAKVLDAGATDSGRPYFVMELVKGIPITDYCDQARLTTRSRLELFMQVCQAVQHAHQKGVIHRDLKPSNVLVTLHDDKPVPKVIDFGIAKAAGAVLTERTLFTNYAQMLGTPLYMSPEQAQLSGLDVDTRSDVYSLGVMLYELLTGTTPFEKQRLCEAAYDEMRRIIREEDPPKPSTRISSMDEKITAISAHRHTDPKGLGQLVRGELDWIVMRALEKDRTRRYETVNGLAMDVERYLHDEAVQACPPSAMYRVHKFARRNKARLVIAGLVLALIVVLGGVVGWAVRDRVARQEERAQQAKESLTRARSWIGENKLALARQELAEARGRLGSNRAAFPGVTRQLDALEAELNQFEGFLDLIDRAHQAEFAQPVALALPGVTAPERWSMPEPSRRPPRDAARAVPLLLQAMSRYEVVERDDWLAVLQGGLLGPAQVTQVRRASYEELLWLADDITRRQQDHRSGQQISPPQAARESLIYLRKAEAASRPTSAFFRIRAGCRKALGEQEAARADEELATHTPPSIAMDHFLLGVVSSDNRNYAEGIKQFEAALRVEPTHYWSLLQLGDCLLELRQDERDFVTAAAAFTGCIMKRPDHARAYHFRGIAYARLRRYEDALADHTRAIELDPRVARYWTSRGVAHTNLGLLDKALADSSKAIELDPKLAAAWNNRGWAYQLLNQRDEALADLTRAIELDPRVAIYWTNRGVAHTNLGLLDKALADSSKAIELDPKYASTWNNRGWVYHLLNQQDEALADLTRAIELDPSVALYWNNRSVAHTNLGLLDKALADSSKAIELDPKFASAWNNRGWVYCLLNRPDEALADLTRAIELDPRVAIYWNNRGAAHMNLGLLDKALADYSKAIELDPKFASTWNNRGWAYQLLNQQDEALADLTRAIELDPRVALYWTNRSVAHMNLGLLDKALADCSKAIELDPKFAAAWFNRGVAHGKLGQLEEAITDHRMGIRLGTLAKPDIPLAHSNLATALNELAWRLVTIADPKPLAPAQAVEFAKEAVELIPQDGHHWNTLGAAQYRAGDWKAAIAALEKSMELRQDGDSFDWFFLAMAHWQLGNKEEARKWCDQAVAWMDKNQPQNEDLLRFRAEAEELLKISNERPTTKPEVK